MSQPTSTIVIIMGVSGCGKTTIGHQLAHKLASPFYDADDFHPPENITKMSQGIPLNDQDRTPWLDRLRTLITTHLEKNKPAVLACSALRKRYRTTLKVTPNVQFVYLQGSFDLIWSRIQARKNHYMKADMLASQFATLEPPNPEEAIVVSIDQAIPHIVSQILADLPTTQPADTAK